MDLIFCAFSKNSLPSESSPNSIHRSLIFSNKNAALSKSADSNALTASSVNLSLSSSGFNKGETSALISKISAIIWIILSLLPLSLAIMEYDFKPRIFSICEGFIASSKSCLFPITAVWACGACSLINSKKNLLFSTFSNVESVTNSTASLPLIKLFQR